jgi:hypothetical protein
MRELATAYEIERRAVEQALLTDLQRQPSCVERLLIESAAGLAVRARRLRSYGRGKDADDVARLLVRTLGRLALRPRTETESESLENYLQRTAAEAASATGEASA